MSFEDASDEELWSELDGPGQPCHTCWEPKDDVELVVDPYLRELYGHRVLIWICGPCLDALWESI